MERPFAVQEAEHQTSRARIEALDGVLRAFVDDGGTIWVIAAQGAMAEEIRREVASVLEPGASVALQIVGAIEEPGRVLFDRIDRERLADGSIRIRSVLRWRGKDYVGEATGESGDVLEVRTAAGATLQALDAAAGRPLGLRLVGVKQMRAFDADLVIVSILSSESPPRRLVGSVAATLGSHHAAAIAVLDACNRFLGQYLNKTD